MKTNNMTLLLIEVVGCMVLVLLLSTSWSTVRSPVEMYAVYLRELSVFRFSTHSVFLIGNLIIIVVVVQSTKLSEKTTPTHKVQFVRHQYDVTGQKIISTGPLYNIAIKPSMQHDVADDKSKPRPQRRSSLTTTKFISRETQMGSGLDGSVSEQSIVPLKAAEAEPVSTVKRESSQLYRRTLSASYERGGAKVINRADVRPELMRSKTVKWGSGKRPGETVGVAGRFDEMNHDEFRRKIESFIEKQRRLIREELAVGGAVDDHAFSRLSR